MIIDLSGLESSRALSFAFTQAYTSELFLNFFFSTQK
jgi:hypothetical protein